uniref:Uncharacterized protein n=1 Tax=Tarenaya spinosa TaxID=228870 RepID=Q1KUY0_9ROSI|nr:hypothetical protein [Tarenaya spinosa]
MNYEISNKSDRLTKVSLEGVVDDIAVLDTINKIRSV